MKQLEDDYLQEIGPELEKIGFSCGVVAGGSYVYKRDLFNSLSEIRDLDLLVFLPNKEIITDLITTHQQDLDRILRLAEVEKHFTREDLNPIVSGHADAIRYSGRNNINQKISIKILPVDIFASSEDKKPKRINVLSKKDKRFYPHKTLDGQDVFIGMVNQKTSNELCILGDPDLISIGNKYCLGVISDVFLSGEIIHESTGVKLLNLKDNLINKIVTCVSESGKPENWSDILVRNDRMSTEFKNYFCKQFPSLENIVSTNNHSKISDFTVSVVSPIFGGRYKQVDLKKKISSRIKEKRYVKSSGPFSSNSNYGLAVFDSGEKAFFKEMLNQYRFRGEIYGLITTSAYFKNIRLPIYTDPEVNLLSYDWFPGDILARQRLVDPNQDTANKIMELELRRAEDHLNAYIRSSQDSKNNNEEMYGSRIHDLFYGRLTGNRLNEYYGGLSIEIEEESVSFSKLATLPIKINNHLFPSINEIIQLSTQRLNPENLREKEMVCGFGDAHSGNIICSNNLEEYSYIDYEFAGFHSPYLDIAKQLYNDTAYQLLYADKLPQSPKKYSVSIKNNYLVIDHGFVPDRISRLIYKTKLEGILLPYRKYCLDQKKPQDKDWKEMLGSALFCCGFLTRNISEFSTQDFIINLANSIEASDLDYYSKKYNV